MTPMQIPTAIERRLQNEATHITNPPLATKRRNRLVKAKAKWDKSSGSGISIQAAPKTTPTHDATQTLAAVQSQAAQTLI